MKLQRYDFVVEEPGEPSKDGEYVKHSEALDWFDSLIDGTAPRHIDRRVYNIVDEERARLRALIAAERGNV